MTYLIRQKIIAAIDSVPIAMGMDVPKFLIYLPEEESQELSLLFMHYILKSRRFKVVYIGKNVTVSDIQDAHRIHQPNFIYTIISNKFVKPPLKEYISLLKQNFPSTHLLLSGYQVLTQNILTEQYVTVLKNLDDTLSFLSGIKNT